MKTTTIALLALTALSLFAMPASAEPTDEEIFESTEFVSWPCYIAQVKTTTQNVYFVVGSATVYGRTICV